MSHTHGREQVKNFQRSASRAQAKASSPLEGRYCEEVILLETAIEATVEVSRPLSMPRSAFSKSVLLCGFVEGWTRLPVFIQEKRGADGLAIVTREIGVRLPVREPR
jgi:hypothetical protein